MWFWLLACTGTDGVKGDSGDSPVDTQDSSVESTPILDTWYSWQSAETGVATGLAWADIDGDNFAELVVAYGNDIQRGPLLVYDNVEGELEVEASWSSESFHYYGHLSTGDVNGDGYTDVAVSRFLGDAGFSEPGGVQVFLNLGGELETTPSWESLESFYSFSCALGDVDNDGDLDLAVAVGEAYYNDPDYSRLYLNDGTGHFGSEAWTTETPRHSFDVGWADFDGDGWLDLAFANHSTPHTLYFNQGGSLSEAPGWSAEGVDDEFEGNSLDWGDVDGDGNLDLIVSENKQAVGLGVVGLWCGPDLALCWQSEDGEDYQSAVSLEDVDGNGRLDVVAGAWWGEARIYLNETDFPETSPSWVSDDSCVIEAFAWEDVDGSDWTENSVSGEGLVAVPGRGRVLSVTGGVAQDGWISGPGEVQASYLEPLQRDLALSNWEKEIGNRIYARP